MLKPDGTIIRSELNNSNGKREEQGIMIRPDGGHYMGELLDFELYG